jgi:hypothetical protein
MDKIWKYFIFAISFFIVLTSCKSLKNNYECKSQINIPSIMYISSINGLEKRMFPTIESAITGTGLFGERVVILERSANKEIISNIEDYWYKIYTFDFNEISWVFGGCFYEQLPLDVPVLVGIWDDVEYKDVIHIFTIRGKYMMGYKYSNAYLSGEWFLNDNIITIKNMLDWQNRIYFDYNEYEIFEVMFSEINRNKIILNTSYWIPNERMLIRNDVYNHF